MNKSKDYAKYIIYKNRYFELKRKLNLKDEEYENSKLGRSLKMDKEHNFYFIHQTDPNNFKEILKSGILKKGKNVPKKRRHGVLALDYVYTAILFEDLHNITQFSSNALILSPKILDHIDAGFNVGWAREIKNDTIILEKDDSEKVKDEKLQKIRGKLIDIQREISQGKRINYVYGWMNNEVLFSKNISLKKYLIGVVCIDCDDEIRKIVNEKYDNIKIFTELKPMPMLDEMLKN